MDRKPVRLARADWASDDALWRGRFEGKNIGTEVTVLFFSSSEIGAGPPLHVHPYDEVFILRQGRALFTIGDERIEAAAGDILLGPANVPHKFVNLGPGLLETTDIHLSPEWIQTNLDDPEDAA
jgi:mannose-6-phosphate isomerase-like protein (cupin superfamily)